MDKDVNLYNRLNFEKYLPCIKNSKILDYGSGSGSLSDWIISKGYPNVTRFDPGYGKTGIDFLVKNQDQFDLVFCIEVLYFFTNIELETDCLIRTLTEHGKIVIQVFNASMPGALSTSRNCTFIKSPMNEFALKDLMKRHGIVPILMEGNQTPTSTWKGFLWTRLQKAWFMAVKLMYLIERGKADSNPTIYSRSIIFFGERLHWRIIG